MPEKWRGHAAIEAETPLEDDAFPRARRTAGKILFGGRREESGTASDPGGRGGRERGARANSERLSASPTKFQLVQINNVDTE